MYKHCQNSIKCGIERGSIKNLDLRHQDEKPKHFFPTHIDHHIYLFFLLIHYTETNFNVDINFYIIERFQHIKATAPLESYNMVL